MNGKDKCEIFRNIRKEVAERYGLKYDPRECHHEGDCRGTCPMCDAEIMDLQRQLDAKGITDVDVSDKAMRDRFQHFINVAGQLQPIDDDGEPLQLQGDVMPPESTEPEMLAGIPAPPDDSFELEGLPLPPQLPEGIIIDDDEDEEEQERTILETYVAGIKFHDAPEIWHRLYEGMELVLVREKDNDYDSNAVAVKASYYVDLDKKTFMLGYIPRGENEVIAALMDMGWNGLLKTEICDMNEHDGKRLEMQIAVSVLNKRNSDVEIITDANRLRFMTMTREQFDSMNEQLKSKGTVYYRWRELPWNQRRPEVGERVLAVSVNETSVFMHLLIVVAKGDACLPFVEGGFDEINQIDNSSAFVLVSLNQMNAIGIEEVPILITELDKIETFEGESQPGEPLSIEATEEVLSRLY